MLRVPRFLAVSSLLSLISCGLIGNTDQDQGAFQSFSLEPDVDNVELVAQKGTDDVLTGFAAGPNGSLIGVSLRLSDDGSTAWISVNGAPETSWTGNGTQSAGNWTDGTAVFLIEKTEDGSFFQLDEDYSGALRELSDVASLPGGAVGYNGTWRSASADGVGQGNGSLRLDLDFAHGVVTGDLSGAYHRAGSGGGSVKGEFDGSLDGAVLVGSVRIDGAKVTGNLLLMGGIYGAAGETVGGALGGELTTSAGTDAQAGGFLLSQVGR